MPSNHKGKGIKGGNYDEVSGVGTSSAGRAGNLDDSLRDEEPGNRQSADIGRQQEGSQQGRIPQAPQDQQQTGRQDERQPGNTQRQQR